MTRYLLFIFLVSMMGTSFAYTGFGVCNHGKETLDTVICDGPTVLKDTTVKGDIKVSGSLQAQGITAKSLTVLGDTQISNSQISGPANITGKLNASQVTFERIVSVTGDDVFLNQTEIKGMLVVTSKSEDTPTVQLQCGSVVKGKVWFDGKKAGVLKITINSAAQGNIQNGASIFVETPAIKGKCENIE